MKDSASSGGANLSSGAIVSISVAAVVVVGGFVALTGMQARASPMLQTESGADALLGPPKLVCGAFCADPGLRLLQIGRRMVGQMTWRPGKQQLAAGSLLS